MSKENRQKFFQIAGQSGVFVVLLFFAVEVYAIAWPQPESAYQSEEKHPQWIERPDSTTYAAPMIPAQPQSTPNFGGSYTYPTPPYGAPTYQIQPPTVPAQSSGAYMYRPQITTPYYGYYSVTPYPYGTYTYPAPSYTPGYVSPWASPIKPKRNSWFDWGNWNRNWPSFNSPSIDLPSFETPAISGWPW